MAGADRRHLGRVFDEVPELYDRVRPTYPDELFADLVAITGMNERSAVLEVGCGTGQATRSLAALGCSVTAVEPGAGMAAVVRQRLGTSPNVRVETSSFEGWDDPGGLFGPTIVRWYPTVQWFDGEGFADLLRSTSLYRSLDRDVREPLLDAIAERIRTRMGDRVSRRYLSVLRVGQRADGR